MRTNNIEKVKSVNLFIILVLGFINCICRNTAVKIKQLKWKNEINL